jgi:hypothetical protein
MNIKEKVTKYILKPFAYISLSAMLALYSFGCKGKDKANNAQPENTGIEAEVGSEFKDFGMFKVSKGRTLEARGIATGDFNGDGREDIAIVYEVGNAVPYDVVEVIKNEMPQQNNN